MVRWCADAFAGFSLPLLPDRRRVPDRRRGRSPVTTKARRFSSCSFVAAYTPQPNSTPLISSNSTVKTFVEGRSRGACAHAAARKSPRWPSDQPAYRRPADFAFQTYLPAWLGRHRVQKKLGFPIRVRTLLTLAKNAQLQCAGSADARARELARMTLIVIQSSRDGLLRSATTISQMRSGSRSSARIQSPH